MLTRKRMAEGFTLVEILIVVVILGILAAIVIPQFTSASESAKESSLVTQLQSIRSQLELYQVQHNGNYPTLAQLQTPDWNNLINTTDVNGATAGTDFGPYLQKAPSNAFTVGTNGTAVVANGSEALTAGWTYNETDGDIRASLSVAQDAALNMDSANDVETY